MKKEEVNLENLRMSTAEPASKLYHIFPLNDTTSICGKVRILFSREDRFTKFVGGEQYVAGQDCKSCFKKAGISE